MRFNFLVCLLLIAHVSLATWHDEEANYRLEIKAETPNAMLFVELKGLLFQSSFENGMTVYDGAGKKLPHRFDKKIQTLFLAGVTGDAPLYVYFGFEEAHPFDSWKEGEVGRIPETQKLRLCMIVGKIDDTPESEMLANPIYQKYLTIKTAEREVFQQEQKLPQMNLELKNLTEKRKGFDALPKEEAHAKRQEVNAEIEIMKKQIEEGKKELEKRKAEVKSKTGEAKISEDELRKFRRKEREIEGLLRQEERKQETRNAEKIFIDQDPHTSFNEMAAQFTGRLCVTDPGIYAFAINSRDSSYLLIDGRPVVSWLYKHEPSNGWEKSGEIFLTTGNHTLAYYWNWRRGKNVPPPYAAAAWKKSGEQEFRMLEENNFSAASRAAVVCCSSKGGEVLPYVKYVLNGYFFIDREKRADWLSCEAVKGEKEFSPVWKRGTETLSMRPQASFAPERASTPPIVLSSKEGAITDIRIDVPDYALTGDDNKGVEPDIFLRLSAPSFIFDDETLEMSLEIESRLAVKASVLLTVKTDRANGAIKEEASWLDFEPTSGGEGGPFAKQTVIKKKFEIKGEYFEKEQLSVTFAIAIPPLHIAQEAIRFIPLADCPELTCGFGSTLLDPHGRRVVPVLHRLTLSEKRSWSFAHSLLNELVKPKKVLVVADDFGGNGTSFQDVLTKALAEQEIEIEFAAWDMSDGLSTMCDNLGKMRRVIAASDAEKLLIVPSVWDTERGEPCRRQLRTLSALIQTAQTNEKIQTVILATPYPSFKDTAIEHELVKGIKQDLKRDFGIEKIIDVNAFVREKWGQGGGFRLNAVGPALYAPFPILMMDEICQKIADSL